MTVKKIAFLFLTIKNVNFPNIWDKYFFGNEDRISLYIHPKYPNEVSWHKDCIIKNLVKTEWGLIVKAYIELLKEAIKDKQNYKFIFLSESCVPIQSFNNFYKTATSDNLSWIKLMNISNYDYNVRLNKSSDKFIKHYSRSMLSRYHVNKLLKKQKELDFFYKMHVGDEFYLSVLLPLTKIKNFPITFDDWEYVDKLKKKIKNKIKTLYEEQEKNTKINNKTKIKNLQEEFNNIAKNPKTIIDTEPDLDNIKKCQSFFYRKFDVKSNIEKYWNEIIKFHTVIITYYDKNNSKNLIKTIELVNKYNNTSKQNLINSEFDWLLKNYKKQIYKTKFEKKSWKTEAYNILTNPKYKPTIQKLNKLIKYKSDNGIINTLSSEFAEQNLSNKYILPDDCVLEVGARYATVSNVINMNLRIKTDQVSVDADLSIKKYHEYNKEQYKNKISNIVYHSFFGIIDNTNNNYYLKKNNDTYGNIVLSKLHDNDIIITLNKETKYEKIKNNQSELNKYKLNKIKYEDIQQTFNLSKPINVLVLDCENCALLFINQIVDKLNDIELIILELDQEQNNNYTKLDKILIDNNFFLHICIFIQAIYIKKNRLKQYSKNYFTTDWFDNLIDINSNLSISKKYNKK